jgi:hypothetical protein
MCACERTVGNLTEDKIRGIIRTFDLTAYTDARHEGNNFHRNFYILCLGFIYEITNFSVTHVTRYE